MSLKTRDTKVETRDKISTKRLGVLCLYDLPSLPYFNGKTNSPLLLVLLIFWSSLG